MFVAVHLIKAAEGAESASASSGDKYGWSSHTWKWRGHTIHYKTAGCGEPIVLVHGFGLSSFHYRRNIPVLAEKYKVYAIDLLGFGKSSKPILQYSMELWRDLLLDFNSEFLGGKPAVLMGNSIGALACLMVNAASQPSSVRGTVLLNSAGAMNNKGVLGDWRILALYPLLLFIDFLLSIPAVSAALFNNVRSRDNIRQVLREGVYRNPAHVDEELVEEVFAPSCDPGAREVFVSVITGPPGPKPWNLMPDVKGPLLVLWGDKDTITPVDGPLGRFLQALPGCRPETTFKMLEDVGHCLHDDKPDLVHGELLPWLDKVMAGQPTCGGGDVAAGTAAAPGVQEPVGMMAAATTAAAAAAAEAVAVAQLPDTAAAAIKEDGGAGTDVVVAAAE
ncbi:hypothetical protein VOLCADRAFT_108436 [Volvox carteri f. nagariensis]|uniref:AB hydrolase-1 domain-containing protein n=1 Tax=Volvox carteri f. nagariensis TaxID=3068 RepID=D8UK43_VOLCA|nr:uncharacterized protein VOLCADRAFT_108436 [Volvox carteri f. nagariensis]EFJ39899.1 hypothetical protein VOLCADRAFT_108436 [Volvox carteri f. nagariensis]|eukprot:XP_002959038.1 hypothetical protein VOLCADRAFT_108436 [Volvox carteri f. nagariensis]